MGITRRVSMVLIGTLVALTPMLGTAAKASSAFGCTFDAYTPRLSSGAIVTTLSVRCSSDHYLYWHARLTKDISYWPDKTVGSSDGVYLFEGGVTYTWVLTNNVSSCPGSGNFFGKLSLQSGSLSTAYVDRSSNVYLSHC